MNENLDLLTNSYDYILKKEQIATHPTKPKENAKLLIYERKKDKITHTTFANLKDFLPPCAIVFNDTKVIKARIFGHKKSGGKCELFINKTLANDEFLAQIKGKIKKNDEIFFDLNLKVKIKEAFEDGTRLVCFYQDNILINTPKVYEILEKIGHIPLPPYIKRDDNENDKNDYQSIFAKVKGAVAAPTASLHFSQKMLDELSKNHNFYNITLHVGAGTFRGVECENIKNHQMHSEFFWINEKTQKLILSDEKILGIGTTAARVIEYFARTGIKNGECDLFLHPQNKPIRLDYLLTNFHLPKSTLIMLVAAFIGREKTIEIYQKAIENDYKFYSYGDGMLII